MSWVLRRGGAVGLGLQVGAGVLAGLLFALLTEAAPLPDAAADRAAAQLLSQLTREEKLQLVHGHGWVESVGGGYIPGIPRVGIPDLYAQDSAAGVNLRDAGATPLPAPLALAASWDTALAADYGTLIARELRALGYSLGLGGGMNLAREPRNGRTFEYLGEDPILAGELAVARIRATQDAGVIATVKHFAGNDQETQRTTSNSVIDERTLRELTLLGFEIAVTQGRPGYVMCAYNLLNDRKSCENPRLLTTILKQEWGFQGVVQSDWFTAVTDAARAANAGLDEEQPGSLDDYGPPSMYGTLSFFNQKLRDALDSGAVPAARLDDMVLRKLRVLYRIGLMQDPPAVPPTHAHLDAAAGDALALAAAQRSIVLLKNSPPAAGDLPLLPLDPSFAGHVVVVGGHADVGVISGGGSGGVPPRDGNAVECRTPQARLPTGFPPCATWYRSSPLASLRARLPHAVVQYVDGTDAAAAARAAGLADVAIVFATQWSSESIDLPDLALPGPGADPANEAYDQEALIAAVSGSARHTVVVLESGTAVTMPWLDAVPAVIEAWYPGVQGGAAIADVLVGAVNPSGKLPLSFPRSAADLPQAAVSPDEPRVVYREGLRAGYRWYDAQHIVPLFPFGHGLSYTHFAYSRLRATRLAGGDVALRFTLRNAGDRAGTEVAQVYAALPAATGEPPQRLVAFRRVSLAPGEARRVTLTVPAARFAIWDHGWQVPRGAARIIVGGSSRDPSALRTAVGLERQHLAHAQ